MMKSMLRRKHQAMDPHRTANSLTSRCIQAKTTILAEYDEGNEGDSSHVLLLSINSDMMRRLPKEEREQIELQVEGFKKTKRDFEREVLKWDDRGNDIIVLAKKMCMIMMEMTDFTR